MAEVKFTNGVVSFARSPIKKRASEISHRGWLYCQRFKHCRSEIHVQLPSAVLGSGTLTVERGPSQALIHVARLGLMGNRWRRPAESLCNKDQSKGTSLKDPKPFLSVSLLCRHFYYNDLLQLHNGFTITKALMACMCLLVWVGIVCNCIGIEI